MNSDIYVVVEHLQGQVLDISYVMVAAARELAAETGGNVVALILGHSPQNLAKNLAVDRVLLVDHPQLADFTPDAYQQVLAKLITDESPRAVLFGDTSIGADVAGVLAARLGLPLVSKCQNVGGSDGSLIFTSQICGGKIMAEGKLPETTTLLAMVPGGYKTEMGWGEQAPEVTVTTAPTLEGLPVKLLQYIEPVVSDVDISKEEILVAIGRGIEREDNAELATELAEVLGGVVCASRPVVDQGWLPTTRLVGKSGKSVKSRLYLALGISGAPEHVEGIDSELIIAVNTDPAAPIFDVAHYGAEMDLLDLLPVLIEQLQDAGAGAEVA